MVKVVFGLGILAILAGVAMIGFGIPINEFGIGNTLIQAGVTALAAGLVVIGLAAVLAQLRRMTALLTTEAGAVRAPADAFGPSGAFAPPAAFTAPEAPFEPAPPVGAVEPRAEVPVERPRLRFPRFGRPEPPVVHDAEEATLSPQPVPRGRPSSPLRAQPEFVPQQGGEPEPAPNMFAAMWPSRPASVAAEPEPAAPQLEPEPAAVAPAVEPARARAEARPGAAAQADLRQVSILKAGVVDGMAYTLFSDGSIEAELPDGTVRFASIAELRAHLEQNA